LRNAIPIHICTPPPVTYRCPKIPGLQPSSRWPLLCSTEIGLDLHIFIYKYLLHGIPVNISEIPMSLRDSPAALSVYRLSGWGHFARGWERDPFGSWFHRHHGTPEKERRGEIIRGWNGAEGVENVFFSARILAIRLLAPDEKNALNRGGEKTNSMKWYEKNALSYFALDKDVSRLI